MTTTTIVRYAGLRYLDRTAALESGEVIPHGARLDLTFTSSAAEALALLREGAADCAEVPLAMIFDPGFAGEFVAMPVFPNRSFTSRSLVGAVPIESGAELSGKRIGLPSDDATTAAWGRSLIEALLGAAADTVSWSESSASELAATVGAGINDVVALPLGADRGGLVPVLPVGAGRSAYEGIAQVFLPILTVVVLRRSVYDAKRWLAVTLTDAFIEAKAEGMARHEYFGALSVGLPWLMPVLESIEANFGGDAYRYGLEPNRWQLERFVSYAAPGADIAEPFAPEVRPLSGVPDTTFYAVPLSHI